MKRARDRFGEGRGHRSENVIIAIASDSGGEMSVVSMDRGMEGRRGSRGSKF